MDFRDYGVDFRDYGVHFRDYGVDFRDYGVHFRDYGVHFWGEKWGNFFYNLPFPAISYHLVGVQLWGWGLKW